MAFSMNKTADFIFPYRNPGSATKKSVYLIHKSVTQLSKICYEIFNKDPNFLTIPDSDPWEQKAPDPGPATMLRNFLKTSFSLWYFFYFLKTLFFPTTQILTPPPPQITSHSQSQDPYANPLGKPPVFWPPRYVCRWHLQPSRWMPKAAEKQPLHGRTRTLRHVSEASTDRQWRPRFELFLNKDIQRIWMYSKCTFLMIFLKLSFRRLGFGKFTLW